MPDQREPICSFQQTGRTERMLENFRTDIPNIAKWDLM